MTTAPSLAKRTRRGSLLQAIGPGILFASAAVGVSHLVQSTRAGAVYGFGLWGLVLLANLTKYPAFRFGPQYAVATRTSLLEGYRRQGRWALWLYGLLTLGTMFTVQAVVTLVTAGLAKVLFGLEASPITISFGLIAICAALIATGGYKALDRSAKVIATVLGISTVGATFLALPHIDWGNVPFWPEVSKLGAGDVLFMAGLVGWMPSAIDVAVWQSLWTLAREDETGHPPSMRESMFDFHAGYIGSALLAFCFVILGAGVMFGTGAKFEDSAGGFAAQVIDLYTSALGPFSRPIIGAAAFATMFSTTLTVIDGFPRALSVLSARLRGAEDRKREPPISEKRVYWSCVVALGIGSMLILVLLPKSMRSLVDLATTLSFLTAPILAWLNHRAVLAKEVPEEHRPRGWLLGMSWGGIAFQAIFAAYFLWITFFS